MALARPVLIQRQTGSLLDLESRRQDSRFALRPQAVNLPRAVIRLAMPRENSLASEKPKPQAQVKQKDS
jgi:hypothetical protein